MDISYDILINGLFAKADKSKFPLGGTFELTSRCTLNCKMCYIHRSQADSGGEMSAEWWLDLAAKARDSGMLLLLLTGGEPMLRQDFDEIYTGCKNLGLLVSVNTNATLIDDRKLRLFADKPPQRLNITLYGTSEETYSALCGNGDSYARVIDAIKELKKAGVNIKLNYSITPFNAADAPAAYDFAKSLDLPIQSVSYIFSPVRACGEAVRLSPADAAKAQFEWNRHVLGDEYMKKFIEFKQAEGLGDGFCSEKINCRAALSTFWVTWDGKMTPCGMMTSPSVAIDDFSEAWQKLKETRKTILLPKKCASCSLRKNCDMCAAVSMAECDKSDEVPQYACRKAHEYAKICNEFISRQ